MVLNDGKNQNRKDDIELVKFPNAKIDDSSISEPIKRKLFVPIVPNFFEESLNNYYKNTTLYSIDSNKFIGCSSHKTNDNIKCITWEQKFTDRNNKEQIYRCCAMNRRFSSDKGLINVPVIFFSNISEIHQGDLENSRKRKLDFMAEARIYKNFMMNDKNIDIECNVYSNQTSQNEYINNYNLQDGEIHLKDTKVKPIYCKFDAEFINKEVEDSRKKNYRSI